MCSGGTSTRMNCLPSIAGTAPATTLLAACQRNAHDVFSAVSLIFKEMTSRCHTVLIKLCHCCGRESGQGLKLLFYSLWYLISSFLVVNPYLCEPFFLRTDLTYTFCMCNSILTGNCTLNIQTSWYMFYPYAIKLLSNWL